MIVMFIGPSSSGKDFFFDKTIKTFGFNKIITHTTRPKRANEKDGVEYYFVDSDTIEKLDKENKLIERRDYNTIHGIWTYATSSLSIDINQDYLVINTWQGYEKYLEYFGSDIVFPIYFNLDRDIRFERAYDREQKQKEKKYLELCRRFLEDEKDFSQEKIEKYNPIIIDNNGTVNETMEQLNREITKLILR